MIVSLAATSAYPQQPAHKAIVVVMGERFKGKRFEMAVEEKGGTLDWTCRSIDLEPEYLPAACR